MRLRTDQWTLVAIGDWNPQIFKPEWIASHLFPEEDGIEAQLEYLLKPAGSPLFRFHVGELLIVPREERLTVGVTSLDNDLLAEAERIVSLSLTLLSHTPIRAVGVNFGFAESEPTQALTDVFDLSDLGALADSGAEVVQTEVTRKFQLHEQVANLKLRLEDGQAQLDLNFHHPVSSAEEGAALLDGTKFHEYSEIALQVLEEVYGVTLEQEEEAEEHDGAVL